MTPEQLLAHVETLGGRLAAEGGRLRVNAPRGGLTDELKGAIAAAKDALIVLLQRREVSGKRELARVDRAGALPVSAFQERLWIAQRLEPASSAFNMVLAWKNPSGVPTTTVVTAIRSLLEKHEILRSTFDEVAGTLVSRPLPASAVPVEVHDLGSLEPAEQSDRVREVMGEEVTKPFDLTAGAPTRFFVCRFNANETATLLVAHHIAVDDWSLAVLEKEAKAACVPGGLPTEATSQLQFADYAAWQRANTDPAVISTELDWWGRYLAQAPQLSVFPPDMPSATESSPEGATRTVVWSPELAAAIRSMTRKEGATLYMAMLAACATVLSWHTGQEDCVFGNPMGTRERTELESMIGPFVNLLLVRLDVKGDPSFAELLRRARDSMLDAYEHRHVPFETLLEKLKPARSPAHSPFFQIALVHHTASAASTDSVREAGGGAMHEITWFARESPAGLECSFEYRSDLFSAAAIDRVASHLEAVLRGAASDSSRRLSELAVLSSHELAQLRQFNATSVEFPRIPFVAQFEVIAERRPTNVALACGSTELTYCELNQRANQLAHELRSKGVTRGARVALCVERSPLLLIALLAIQKAGGAYVPLDPGFPSERLSFMLADSNATVLLTSDEAAADIEIPEGVSVVDIGAVPVMRERSGNLPLEVQPDDPVYVIYTSGSTGRPKGVTISHGSLTNLLWSMAKQPGLTSTDILAAVTTISFDIAGLELYLPLLAGARIELVPLETSTDGHELAVLLRERAVTVLQATPATWRLLLEADWQAPPAFRAFCGGEALPRDLAQSLLGRVSELWNLYGPTETTIWSTAERVKSAQDITIGRPIANTQVYVVGKAGALQPIGVPGELWIGGAGVALGYLNRPELTEERFVADQLGTSPSAGMRLYRTGDLGRWREDGRLEHLGRLDHQVKIRGFRIEVGEVEASLAALEAVRQAVVVARDAGSSDRRLIAYVVYQPGQDLTVSEVRRHLRSVLPEYMVPSLVVAMDAIPLTPNGKVDRAALPDPFGNVAAGNAQFEPPTTEMELLLASVWTEVLKVERVGVSDNFFDLGGHSLLSLRVASAVNAQSGWRMDPRTLFFQTLGQIAATATSAGARVRRRA